MKYGWITAFRVGDANNDTPLVRMPPGYQSKSEELCMLGSGKALEYKCFSAEGDSGSCIFDLHGRVGGMLTGGGRIGDCGDAIRMEWLLNDMKRYGYDLELL